MITQPPSRHIRPRGHAYARPLPTSYAHKMYRPFPYSSQLQNFSPNVSTINGQQQSVGVSSIASQPTFPTSSLSMGSARNPDFSGGLTSSSYRLPTPSHNPYNQRMPFVTSSNGQGFPRMMQSSARLSGPFPSAPNFRGSNSQNVSGAGRSYQRLDAFLKPRPPHCQDIVVISKFYLFLFIFLIFSILILFFLFLLA